MDKAEANYRKDKEKHNKLSDSSEIRTGMDLPKEERFDGCIEGLNNPFCFRCGEMVIHVNYKKDGLSLEDCINEYFSNRIL